MWKIGRRDRIEWTIRAIPTLEVALCNCACYLGTTIATELLRNFFASMVVKPHMRLIDLCHIEDMLDSSLRETPIRVLRVLVFCNVCRGFNGLLMACGTGVWIAYAFLGLRKPLLWVLIDVAASCKRGAGISEVSFVRNIFFETGLLFAVVLAFPTPVASESPYISPWSFTTRKDL